MGGYTTGGGGGRACEVLPLRKGGGGGKSFIHGREINIKVGPTYRKGEPGNFYGGFTTDRVPGWSEVNKITERVSLIGEQNNIYFIVNSVKAKAVLMSNIG